MNRFGPVQSSFPKKCPCGRVIPNRSAWRQLPPASGGLHAMALEWRNCACGSTLVAGAETTGDFSSPGEISSPGENR